MKIKKKTISKPATEAQKKARERNWNKGQVLCIKTIANNLKQSKTTPLSEQLLLADIIYKLDKIFKDWNK